jgi:CheY-like chemotaxis protein
MLASPGAADTLRKKGLESIQKSADRASALTRQLLAFSRKQLLNPKVLNLNHVITDMSEMLHRLIGENIELCPILEENLACVQADAGQIEQVIMNMAVNARDAMPRGGKLVIETMMVRLEALGEIQSADFVPGDYVRITISDNGVGMTAEEKAHLFEPFFTTKGVGKGTGLGLATSYGIVKQSGGHILVYSEAGHGTAFKIYLPAIAGSADPKPAFKTMPPKAGHETILLVEDENELREMGIRILQNCGYTVLAACNGKEGVELAKANRGRIDLIITDVIMPVMGGMEMVNEIKPLLPHVQVLFMSGYTDDALAKHGVLDPGICFLEKPFVPARLANKVREALEQSEFSSQRFPKMDAHSHP